MVIAVIMYFVLLLFSNHCYFLYQTAKNHDFEVFPIDTFELRIFQH